MAMNLIAQRPAQDCGHDRVVYCDGGHPALGHPRVFINLVSFIISFEDLFNTLVTIVVFAFLLHKINAIFSELV